MNLHSIQRPLRKIGLPGRYDALFYVFLDGEAINTMIADGQIYTDDLPTLEFTAARRPLVTMQENATLIEEHLVPLDKLFDFPDPNVTLYLNAIRKLVMHNTESQQETMSEAIKAYNELYSDL